MPGGNYMGSISVFLTVFVVSFTIGIASGIAGGVYRLILAYEPILNFWFRFGNRFEGKWFFPPIWGCHKCISGQLALWISLAVWVFPLLFGQGSTFSRFGVHWAGFGVIVLFGLILAITTAVLFSLVIGKLISIIDK